MCKDDPGLMERLLSRGIPRERLPCPGCRSVSGACPVISARCETWSCVNDKKVEYCFQCGDFPCPKLNPSSDRAAVLPHNVKVFNLCTIKRTGAEGFVRESSLIQKRYFQGKMEIGKGPRLPQV